MSLLAEDREIQDSTILELLTREHQVLVPRCRVHLAPPDGQIDGETPTAL